MQCCHKASSPFTACSLQYSKMLRESPIEGVLGPVYHVFGDFAEDRDSLTTEARALNLSMSGHLWWRFLEFLWWPYSFGTFVRGDVPWSEKVVLACRLWTTCRYCLDWDFTLKVANLFPGPMSMLRDKDFLRNIEQWMRHAHQGNMWVERFFPSCAQRLRTNARQPNGLSRKVLCLYG